MAALLNDALSLGDLERELRQEFPGVRRHQLVYAIQSRGIEPARRLGITRVWSRSQIPVIKQALNGIANRREVAVV
jgi:hypothetical protein